MTRNHVHGEDGLASPTALATLSEASEDRGSSVLHYVAGLAAAAAAQVPI